MSDPLSILHVDDDEEFGELVKLFLEGDGNELDCRVTLESSPEAALDRIRSSGTAFDCVVSDYNMPAMNGIEFLERVHEARPELPLLLFSGEETKRVAAEIIRVGLTDYLRKGFGAGQYTLLVRRVEHAVGAGGEFDPEAEVELDGVGVVGRDERFERVDTTYASFYDYRPEEIEGRHWSELHPEEEVAHIRTHVLPVVREGGKWTGRSEGLRADGSTFTESKLVTPMDDGRLLIAVSELDEDAAPAED